MHNQILMSFTFFGAVISLIGYFIGAFLKKKLKLGIFNPLLVAIVFVILVLLVFRIDYNTYNNSADILSYFLTPATVCLAVPLYEQLSLLRKNLTAVLLSILSGCLASCLSVFLIAVLFSLSHEQYVTLLPKSITTAIGMGISGELGGITSITAAVIIITGIFGNMISGIVFRIFKITHPVARGVALGTSSHAIGTAKAMELGEVECAMSGLSIAVAGIMTVFIAPLFASFLK